MASSLISVVVPAFHAEGTIAAALGSVLGQGAGEIEIIVVDDASTDETVQVARRALSNHPHHRIIELQENRGPAGARNAGVREASGEWIAFLDGDDVWLPWRLRAQQAFMGGDVGLICGGTVEMGEEAREPAEGGVSSRTLALRDFAVRNEVATSTVLVRRQLVIDAGKFDERFRGPEDYDLWIRIAARAKVLKLNCPLVRYRDVPGSLSRDERTFLPQVLRVLDKAYGPDGALHDIPARRRAKAYQHLCAAWMAAERGARGRAWLLFGRSLCYWPGSFKPYLRAPWCRMKLMVGMARGIAAKRHRIHKNG